MHLPCIAPKHVLFNNQFHLSYTIHGISVSKLSSVIPLCLGLREREREREREKDVESESKHGERISPPKSLTKIPISFLF